MILEKNLAAINNTVSTGPILFFQGETAGAAATAGGGRTGKGGGGRGARWKTVWLPEAVAQAPAVADRFFPWESPNYRKLAP